MTRIMSLSLIMALSLGTMRAQTAATETPAPPAQEADKPSHAETPPVTLARVTEMLRSGMTSQAVITQVKLSGSAFDLSVEDVIRLTRLGAAPELIQMMTRAPQTPAPVEETAHPSTVQAATAGTLTHRKIVKMYHKGVSPDVIVEEIARKGLKEPIELDQLLALGAEGIPDNLLLAMAAGARQTPTSTSAEPSPASAGMESTPEVQGEPGEPPLKAAEIRRMLERKLPPDDIVSAIETRGIAAPPSLEEAIAMRKLGATDPIIAAINTAALDLGEEAADDESDSEATHGALSALPPAANTEILTVLSYPAGARVYLSPSRTRMEERFRHDYLVGRTPVSVTVPPDDYTLIVEKRAGTFEAGLLPAWRTMHDPPGVRSVLDETELTFDPLKCCLPGSVSGVVDLRPIPEEQPRAIIGDQFDGLPPYLFDGEMLQILRVRRSQITEVMKLYHVRKTAGQPRALIATFIPAEGDTLDLDTSAPANPGASFDSEIELPQLQYLLNGPGQKGLAAALGVETEHLGNAIAVLRNIGKVILHQQVAGGLRLLTLAIDYNGRLRVTDQTVLPVNPFAAAPVKKGKKKAAPVPAPIPPLPALARVVVPGLGAPRLDLVNPGPAPVALILGDGEFCYAPAGATTECVLDPGTHQVRVMNGGQQRGGGTMHLSYHARYTMKMPPMPVR